MISVRVTLAELLFVVAAAVVVVFLAWDMMGEMRGGGKEVISKYSLGNSNSFSLRGVESSQMSRVFVSALPHETLILSSDR